MCLVRRPLQTVVHDSYTSCKIIRWWLLISDTNDNYGDYDTNDNADDDNGKDDDNNDEMILKMMIWWWLW